MLLAEPRHWFSWSYDVTSEGDLIGEVEQVWFGQKAVIRTRDGIVLAQREGFLHRRRSLTCGGRVIALAQHSNPFVRAFDVDAEGRLLRLEAIAFWSREFGVFENGVQMGRILPTGIFSRCASLDFNDELPIRIQLFLLWLVISLWRQAAHSSQ